MHGLKRPKEHYSGHPGKSYHQDHAMGHHLGHKPMKLNRPKY
jgi:hypothetical protein